LDEQNDPLLVSTRLRTICFIKNNFL
jgi:hypothetical protein